MHDTFIIFIYVNNFENNLSRSFHLIIVCYFLLVYYINAFLNII